MRNPPHLILPLVFAAALLFPPDHARGQTGASDSSRAAGAARDSASVVVTYYHSTLRCYGCLTIEKFTDASMRYLFEKELREGKIVWRVVDFEKEKGGVSAGRYAIENQALIVSQYRNGKEVRWKRLGKVWDLLGDYGKFQEYISESVREYL